MTLLFGLGFRQATGYVGSQLRLMGLEWAVPGSSALSRRQKTLKVNIPNRGSEEPLHLLIDSSAIKVKGEGAGEWNVRKNGSRVWRTIYMGIDEKSLEMPAAEFTIADVDDAPKLPEQFDQIAPDAEIAIVSAGSAFDTHKCHGAIAARSAAAQGRHAL